MNQPIQGSILSTLKSIFNRIFKDILSGFDEGGYEQDSEKELDLKKSSNRPKDSKIAKALDSIEPDKQKGMSQVFKNKTNPKDYAQYEVKYFDLSEAKGYEGYQAAEIYDVKSGKMLKSVIGKESEFKKKIKEEIAKLMKEEEKKHPPKDEQEGSKEDTSASKNITMNLRKIVSSNFIDFEIDSIKSNYPLLEVSKDINELLNSDELYDGSQEGDNYLSIDVGDDSFTINNTDDNFNSDNIDSLSEFFHLTTIIYLRLYQEIAKDPKNIVLKQLKYMFGDLMDQISTDLISLGIEINPMSSICISTSQPIMEEINDYTYIYDSVISKELPVDKQDIYGLYIRQMKFMIEN